MIAFSVGTTLPTVAPMPRCTSGIAATWRNTIGSRAMFSSCARAAGSTPTPRTHARMGTPSVSYSSYDADMGITAAQIRKLALALPEAVESSHFGVADFRVDKRIFATIHPGDKTGVLLRLDDDLASSLAASDPQTFERIGAKGHALKVVFARVDRAQYAHLLGLAHAAILPKKKSGPAKRRG